MIGWDISEIPATATVQSASNVDIYRDGGLLNSVSDSSVYTDNTGNKGGRTYVYQVCEADGGACSAEVSITF